MGVSKTFVVICCDRGCCDVKVNCASQQMLHLSAICDFTFSSFFSKFVAVYVKTVQDMVGINVAGITIEQNQLGVHISWDLYNLCVFRKA